MAKRIIVDLGCSGYPWPIYTAKKYKLTNEDEYIGIDLCPENIKYASEEINREKKHYGLKGTYRFLVGNYFHKLPFENNSITELHFHGLQPHADDDSCHNTPLRLEHIFREAQRILIPKGRVFSTSEWNDYEPEIRSRTILKAEAEKHQLRVEKFIAKSGGPRRKGDYEECELAFTEVPYAGRKEAVYFVLAKD